MRINLSPRHVTSVNQLGSFFPRSLLDGELRDPGNEVGIGIALEIQA